MHGRALEIHESSCMPRTAKSFFIPVVHSPPGAVDTWQHQSSSLREAEPEAMGHVAAPELTSPGRQGLELRGTW
jgi:hypothetical protein